MAETPSKPRDYSGPERRLAFFPRRLRTVRGDAMLIDLSKGDRRSGQDRRKGGACGDPGIAKR